jgi:hypothetical protein
MIVADVIDRKQLPDAPPREVESIALLSPSWPAQSAANGIASYVENLVSGMLAVGASPAVITANAESGSSDPILRQLRFPTGWRSRQLDRICYRIVGDKRVHWKMTTAIVRELAALRRSGVLDIVEMEESFGWANDVSAPWTGPDRRQTARTMVPHGAAGGRAGRGGIRPSSTP